MIDIAHGALQLSVDKLSKPQMLRLAQVLESLGWSRAQRHKTAGIRWWPPGSTNAQ